MKQRLGIAQAVLNDPDVLVLDEPTNHLDIDSVDMLELSLIHIFPAPVQAA